MALTTLCDLVGEVRALVKKDAVVAGLADDGISFESGGSGAQAYSDAVGLYLAFLVDQVANHASSACGWNHPNTQMRAVFSRQAIAMTWDYAEANIFSESSGSYHNLWERQVKGFEALGVGQPGLALQADAATQTLSSGRFISTDPPYYDNIGYADLSDFFYVWLRRTLRNVFPELLATIAVPKSEELVATPYRHGGKEQAERFFLDGMTKALKNLAEQAHPAAPISIYYAFKQSETEGGEGTASTGWETFLEAVLRAGFAIGGTWPIRTEKEGRVTGNGTNALASSIIISCRIRPPDARTVSRRDFIRELNTILPEALDEMTKGTGDANSPVAPVDLSQAIIGPGMAVFSKFAAVLEADGKPMEVKTALQLINRFLAEDEFDADTQFCLHWFGQQGWSEGLYGEADVLARAKSTSVNGLIDAGVLHGGKGKVRLLRPAEYPADWDPRKDMRLPIWEALHQLIRAFRADGEGGAGRLLAHVKDRSEAIRQLAYRLYTLCERHAWVEDARAYNDLVTSWAGIDTVAEAAPKPAPQLKLFGGK